MNSAAYNQLIGRIDAFTRRYYKTQLVRGTLLAFILLVPAWLIFSGAEYFGHFSTVVRTVLFWGFATAAGFAIWKLILIPAAGLYRLGKVISHEEAAKMIRQLQETKKHLLEEVSRIDELLRAVNSR